MLAAKTDHHVGERTSTESHHHAAFLEAVTAADSTVDEVIETHISHVALAPHFAYKLKKPVRFKFVDFSSLETRREVCADEIRLNRRFAPHVYLDAVPLRRTSEGRFVLANDPRSGEIIDWVVKMRRLPADQALDQVLQRGKLTGSQRQQLLAAVELVLAASTPVMLTPDDYRARLFRHINENRFELTAHIGDHDRELVESLHDSLLRYMELNDRVWQQRVCDAHIVEGHGDLRPCHIYLSATPAVIDCVEFSQDLRIVDTLDEFCFLMMELDRMNQSGEADAILKWYGNVSGRWPIESLVNFYKSYRALVRWKVELLTHQTATPAAEMYRALASHYRDLFDPLRIVVIGGLSGSGKSVLADALNARLYGAVVRTDTLRNLPEAAPGEHEVSKDATDGVGDHVAKQSRASDHGVQPSKVMGPSFAKGKYALQQRDRVYHAVLSQAARILPLRRCVFLDGTFAAPKHRAQAESLAAQFGATLLTVWCVCSDELRKQRVLERALGEHVESEINADQLAQQSLVASPPGDEALGLDTTASIPDQIRSIIRALNWSFE